MNRVDDERLRELCEAASKEMNPDRLMVLIREINELLDQAEVPGQKPLPAA